MKRKHLESALSSIQREFPNPNISLEQYPTSAELASCVILAALERNDLGEGTTALDLGCGTGMLALGAAVVETDQVFGVDCDEEALRVAKQNCIDMELESQMSFIAAQVKDVSCAKGDLQEEVVTVEKQKAPRSKQKGRGRGGGGGRGRGGRSSSSGGRGTGSSVEIRNIILTDDDGLPLQSNCVDTVLTNPPFGTKNNAGMDIRFLRTACRLARHAVYSFHKSSTRQFLIKLIQEDWNYEVEVIAQMRFEIPQMYKFHKEKSKDIEVDLIRVCVAKTDDNEEEVQCVDECSESDEVCSDDNA